MRDRGPDHLRLRGAISLEPTPKPDGGVRSVVRLAPADERGYAASVRPAVHILSGALGPRSHANRVIGWHDGLPVLEPWRRARRRWRAEARRLALRSRIVVTADVRDCYPSIEAGVVRERLLELGVAHATVGKIEGWLRSFAEHGVRGLPVGPAPSALLADVVLAPGDRALRGLGVSHLRWVDDVTIFAPGRREAQAALDEVRRTWRAAGLDPNDAKTGTHPDPPAWLASAGGHASPAGSDTLR